MTTDPNPESTWGATPEYQAQWEAEHGSAEAKAEEETDIVNEEDALAKDYVEAGGDPNALNTDIEDAETS